MPRPAGFIPRLWLDRTLLHQTSQLLTQVKIRPETWLGLRPTLLYSRQRLLPQEIAGQHDFAGPGDESSSSRGSWSSTFCGMEKLFRPKDFLLGLLQRPRPNVWQGHSRVKTVR